MDKTRVIDKDIDETEFNIKDIMKDHYSGQLIGSFIKPTREKTIKSVAWVIAASLLMAFAVKYFIIPAQILSAGVSGISIAITRINGDVDSFAVWNILLNFPLFIFGMVKIGKRFSLLSALSIAFVSIFSILLPDPSVVNIMPDAETSNRLVAVITGQLLSAIAIALFYIHGSSSGGIDFISTYLSIKKGISIAFYAMIINTTIVITSLFIIEVSENGFDKLQINSVISVDLIYTFIGIIVSRLVLERAYPKFKKMKLNITSEKYKMISKLLKEINYPHAWTLVPIKGGYTGSDKTMITIICTYMEIKKTVELIYLLDNSAFIYTSKVPNVYGRFTIVG